MYDAAKAVLDLSLNAEAEPILNLVHPRPVRWWEIINWVRDALDKTFSGDGMDELPIISPREWLAALEERAEAPSSEDFDAVVSFANLCVFSFSNVVSACSEAFILFPRFGSCGHCFESRRRISGGSRWTGCILD